MKNPLDFDDPGSAISAFIEERQWQQKKFASVIGISAALLSMLVQNKRRLTDTVIAHLSKETGYSEGAWRTLRNRFEESPHSDGPRPKALTRESDLNGMPIQGANQSSSQRAGILSQGGRVLSNADIHRAVLDGALKISPYNPANLGPAYLDLTVGSSRRFNQGPEEDRRENLRRETIDIKPGETWKIWTNESIQMPDTLCGRIAACGELITFGIMVGFGIQIDPLWQGQPFVILSHLGEELYELNLGEPFVSLEVSVLTSPTVSEDQLKAETS